MANVINGNTLFVDATGSVTAKPTLVHYVVLTATSANAVLVLSDSGTDAKKVDVRVAAAGESKIFDFSTSPLRFPNGVKVATATSAAATIVVSY